MNIFLDLNLEGKTIIMATHDSNIVDALEKRVIAFEDRKVISDVKK
jgi:cell division transport system ATP-binding protein